MGNRTTVTLDEDVIVRLKEASKRRGTSFKVTLNDTIRLGFVAKEKEIPPFRVQPLDIGSPLPGMNYDCAAELQALEDEERYR